MGDDWHVKAALYVRAGQEQGRLAMALAYFFFLTIIVAGHVVLQALLTALLLKNFEQSLSQEAEEQLEKERLALINRDKNVDEVNEEVEDDHDKLACTKCKDGLKGIQETFHRTFTGNLVAYDREQEKIKRRAKKRELMIKKQKAMMSEQAGESSQKLDPKQNKAEESDMLEEKPWSFIHHNLRLISQLSKVFRISLTV